MVEYKLSLKYWQFELCFHFCACLNLLVFHLTKAEDEPRRSSKLRGNLVLRIFCRSQGSGSRPRSKEDVFSGKSFSSSNVFLVHSSENRKTISSEIPQWGLETSHDGINCRKVKGTHHMMSSGDLHGNRLRYLNLPDILRRKSRRCCYHLPCMSAGPRRRVVLDIQHRSRNLRISHHLLLLPPPPVLHLSIKDCNQWALRQRFSRYGSPM